MDAAFSTPFDLGTLTTGQGPTDVASANEVEGCLAASAGRVVSYGFANGLIGGAGNGASGTRFLVYGKASGFSAVNLDALDAKGLTVAGTLASNAAKAEADARTTIDTSRLKAANPLGVIVATLA
jgi:hypothetical protein